MIKISTKFKMDLSGLNKLKRQLKSTQIDVGWLDRVDHWNSTPSNPISVAALAAHLHYNSPWKDSFMLSSGKSDQVSRVVKENLSKSFGLFDFSLVAMQIGQALEKVLINNIENVSSPSNSQSWVNVKGFDDPLVYGSYYGNSPNLISEIKSEVR